MSQNLRQNQQKLSKANNKRNELNQLPKSIAESLQFMSQLIHRDMKKSKKFSLCMGTYKKKFLIEERFEKAFKAMSISEKVDYYGVYVDKVYEINETSKMDLQKKVSLSSQQKQLKKDQKIVFTIKLLNGSKTFEETEVSIERLKVESTNKMFPEIDLRNYLIRKSKKKGQNLYVLESIKGSYPQTVRFGFISLTDEERYLPVIVKKLNQGLILSIERQISSIANQSMKPVRNQQIQIIRLRKQDDKTLIQEQKKEKEIEKNKQKKNLQRRISQSSLVGLGQCSEISGDSSDEDGDLVFYSIKDLSEYSYSWELESDQSQQEVKNVEISSSQIKSEQQQSIQVNSEGLVILPKKYLLKKHRINPFNHQKAVVNLPYQSIILKNDWSLQKGGALKFINQAKIKTHNEVMKFVVNTLKKNIFSGKGILNISLPVTIFATDSNLQRVCSSMGLAPEFLEPVSKSKDKLQRFKKVISLGLSNSILYFDIEKVFNPILGQTYQGFIRGCPIYAEQISHHPPITSIYFIGRGYKIMCSLESKAYVHVNCGGGVNQGFNRVIFDDGQQVIYQTPPAELCGLAFGDRKFNFNGKGIYIDLENNYYCEMKIRQDGGLFTKKKKQFADQIEGQILLVKPQFLRKFMQTEFDKRPTPSEKDIKERIVQISGRWTTQLKIGNKVYYTVQKDLPDKLIDQIYPLNSNSNYRQDIYYRKRNDYERSQTQKQRLEVIQRNDRKLRAKYGKSSH